MSECKEWTDEIKLYELDEMNLARNRMENVILV